VARLENYLKNIGDGEEDLECAEVDGKKQKEETLNAGEARDEGGQLRGNARAEAQPTEQKNCPYICRQRRNSLIKVVYQVCEEHPVSQEVSFFKFYINNNGE
jgi:hypothetical protein